MAKSLTVKGVEAIKPGAVRREISDGALPGLYLIVQPSGAMSWAVRYRYGNRPRKMTIGPYPVFSLARAREAAGAALRAVSEGRDPGAEKLAKVAARLDAANLATAVLDEFLQRYVRVKNRESTARDTSRFIDNEVRPKWKHRQIQTITKRDIVELLDSIVDRGAPASANRVHAILRRFFNWAVERDIVQTSPVATVPAPTPEISRDRVLASDEIRLVWMAAERIGWPFGAMVKLLLLTGQRRDEVSRAVRAEFDLVAENPHWTIPKERAKNGKAHVLPLPRQVVEILEGLPVVEGKAKLIFTTTGKTPISGFSRAKQNLDDEMLALARDEAVQRGEDPETVEVKPWRFHDLRRTAASGMASLGFPVHVVEAVLNHKSGQIKGVAAVYNRYDYADEKRQAVTAWATAVQDLVGIESKGNVVTLRKAKHA